MVVVDEVTVSVVVVIDVTVVVVETVEVVAVVLVVVPNTHPSSDKHDSASKLVQTSQNDSTILQR